MDNLIGSQSSDGLLIITGIHGKIRRHVFYTVLCTKCSIDKDLFPNDFLIRKSDFLNGTKPCGCAKKPRWTSDQWLVLAQRRSPANIKVIGYAEDFHGKNTNIKRQCVIHGILPDIQLRGLPSSGCKLCSDVIRRHDFVAVEKCCIQHCSLYNYEYIGFLNGYKNIRSQFTYKCPHHGNRHVPYYSIQNNRICKMCSLELSGFYGLYVNRTSEFDTLYVLSFDSKFIKVGRSFDMSSRLKNLAHASGASEIDVVCLYTGTHEDVFKIEQSLLLFLKSYFLEYSTSFTKESFCNQSLDYIKYFMSNHSTLIIKD